MPFNRINQFYLFTAAEWATSLIILETTQAGIESDTGKIKKGNGLDVYSALSYLPGFGGGGGGGGDLLAANNLSDVADAAISLANLGGISDISSFDTDDLSEGATNKYFTESRVRGTVLTGLSITGSSISASDTVLQAFGKLQNQVSGVLGGAIVQGVWNATTNSPALASGVGTTGYYYVVNVAGSTNLDGITDWKVGDWAIFINGVWNKVDNTDAVSSVNGLTGAVSLTTSDISEGGNQYFTDERAQDAIGAIVDASLEYSDASNILSRAPLTGAITAAGGSNTTALGSFTKAQLDTAVSDGNVAYYDYGMVLFNQIFS